MDIPTWAENGLAGVLLTMLIIFIKNTLQNVSDKQKADKGVDTRVLEQLAERDKYVEKVENRNDELYERNKKLTDEMNQLMRDTIKASMDQSTLIMQVQENARKETKDAIVRVHEKVDGVETELKLCRADHQECTARVAGLERIVLKTMGDTAPTVSRG